MKIRAKERDCTPKKIIENGENYIYISYSFDQLMKVLHLIPHKDIEIELFSLIKFTGYRSTSPSPKQGRFRMSKAEFNSDGNLVLKSNKIPLVDNITFELFAIITSPEDYEVEVVVNNQISNIGDVCLITADIFAILVADRGYYLDLLSDDFNRYLDVDFCKGLLKYETILESVLIKKVSRNEKGYYKILELGKLLTNEENTVLIFNRVNDYNLEEVRIEDLISENGYIVMLPEILISIIKGINKKELKYIL